MIFFDLDHTLFNAKIPKNEFRDIFNYIEQGKSNAQIRAILRRTKKYGKMDTSMLVSQCRARLRASTFRESYF